jgi:hypothetical protein
MVAQSSSRVPLLIKVASSLLSGTNEPRPGFHSDEWTYREILAYARFQAKFLRALSSRPSKTRNDAKVRIK